MTEETSIVSASEGTASYHARAILHALPEQGLAQCEVTEPGSKYGRIVLRARREPMQSGVWIEVVLPALPWIEHGQLRLWRHHLGGSWTGESFEIVATNLLARALRRVYYEEPMVRLWERCARLDLTGYGAELGTLERAGYQMWFGEMSPEEIRWWHDWLDVTNPPLRTHIQPLRKVE